MKSRFRVIVAGGGPAGSAAAHTLAAAGVDVCLIDKCTFPRDKLCGGLLTLRSRKTFDEIFGAAWDPVVEVVSRGMDFYDKDRLLNSVRDYRDLYFTRRYNFDNYLLGLAEKAGAHLLLGSDVRTIDTGRKTLVLGSGASLGYDYLVGADGINSRVGRTLFGRSFDRASVAYGLEMEVPLAGGIKRPAGPEIYFGFIRWGYGWVFPKKETLTVGVGGLPAKNPDLRKQFAEFLKMRLGRIPGAGLKGHYLPFGNFRKRPGKGNVLLCGDAAGLADPITGEGIAFAMQSGYYAALSIIEVMDGKTRSAVLDVYAGKCRVITEGLHRARRLRNLIFPGVSQRVFLSVLPKTKSVPRKHMELMADEIGYGEYSRFIMAKIRRGIAGRISPFSR